MPTMTFDVNGDVRRQNLFTFECPEVLHDLEMAVLSVSGLFNYSSTVEELNVGNRPEKVAGKQQLQSASLILLDTVDKDAIKQAYEWYNKVYDIEGNFVGYPSEYKHSATLNQFEVNGDPVRTWELTGVWPSSININTDFTYESEGEFVQLSLTIEIDKAVLSS